MNFVALETWLGAKLEALKIAVGSSMKSALKMKNFLYVTAEFSWISNDEGSEK